MRRFLNLIAAWYYQRLEGSKDGVETFERQLEQPTPLDRSKYAALIGRGPKRGPSDDSGFFQMMEHGSGG